MKKLIVIIAAAVMMTSFAAAQTATGQLTVTATVNGSISLVFNSDGAGVALSSGAGTNAATLNFGTVSAYGALAAGITRPTPTATDFTVSTPVDVLVSKANVSSANYTLTTQLNAADAADTWSANGAAFTNATPATATAAGTYGSNVAVTLAITIPFTTASGTTISNIVDFTATAN